MHTRHPSSQRERPNLNRMLPLVASTVSGTSPSPSANQTGNMANPCHIDSTRHQHTLPPVGHRRAAQLAAEQLSRLATTAKLKSNKKPPLCQLPLANACIPLEAYRAPLAASATRQSAVAWLVPNHDSDGPSTRRGLYHILSIWSAPDSSSVFGASLCEDIALLIHPARR